MTGAIVRVAGRAGRITLNRPDALNAATHEMCLEIESALDSWRGDDGIDIVVIDAAGKKAFCAGGDIAKLHDSGSSGDLDYGRRFWADEYRLNEKIFAYPKPVASFMQGYTMGGGVGLGCHGTHRVVGESSRIAMPECGIGLVPDVGGSFLLALSPGRMGEYLALTATRMGPGDALYAGFANRYVPEDRWTELIAELEATGDPDRISEFAELRPTSPIASRAAEIDALFAGESLGAILELLQAESDAPENCADVAEPGELESRGAFARESLETMSRNSPLSMACAVEMLRRLRRPGLTLGEALDLEYRFVFRSMESGDLLEGIRAAIIDRDRAPKWRHELENVPEADVSAMLEPLGEAQTRSRYGKELA